MIVPPFVPPPIEIPGNVAQQPYGKMIRFVRKVVIFHAFAWTGVAGLAHFESSNIDLWQSSLTLLSSLVALSLVRGLVKGRHWEMYGSALLMPLVFFSLGSLGNHLFRTGISPFTLILGPLLATLYICFCGRDLSFFGMAILSSLGTGLVLWALDWSKALPLGTAGPIFIFSLIHLLYIVYDLAMITRRRRLDEALGAVIDLFRDCMNVVAYPLRVWSHWRKHRIWSQRLDLGDARALAWRAMSKFEVRPRSRGKTNSGE